MNTQKIIRSLQQFPTKEKQIVLENLKQLVFADKNTYQAKIKDHKRCTCPSCSSENFIKFGYNKSQEQRYRCKDCAKIFSDSTGSAIYRLQLKPKWHRYIDLMFDDNYYSVRKMGKALKINHKTAFDWRHKILFAINQKLAMLHGVVEIDDVQFDFSQKGRKVSKRPRKQGDSGSVKILTALDREGNMIMNVVRIGKLQAEDVEHVVGGVLNPELNILTSGKRPEIKLFAKKYGVRHEAFKVSKPSRSRIYHVNTIKEKANRLANRIKYGFKGVATKYLDNYCNWFKLLESAKYEVIDFYDESFKSHESHGLFHEREVNYQLFLAKFSS